MRTTIELSDEARGKLLEIAARRGEKGFSSVVEEALEEYFAAEGAREEKVRKAVESLGKLTEKDATAIAAEVEKLRATWR